MDSVGIDPAMFETGGDTGRQWMPQENWVDDVEGNFVVHQAGKLPGIVAAARAAGDGLERRRGHALPAQFAQQRRSHVRFADAGIRARDERARSHSDLLPPATARTASTGVIGSRNRLLDSGPPVSATKYT